MSENSNSVSPDLSYSRQHKTTLVTFLVLMLGMLAIVLKMVGSFVLAVMIGGILALISDPLQRKLVHQGWRPNLASLCITVGVLLVVVAPLFFIVKLAIEQAIQLGHSLAENQDLSLQSLVDRITQIGFLKDMIPDAATVQKQLTSGAQNLLKAGSGAVLALASNVPALILQVFLAMITFYFLLIDGRAFLTWLIDRIPLDDDVRGSLLESFRNTTISTIWATLAAAGAQATLMLIGYLVLRVPAAFLAGGATFVFAWIPMVGSTPVWVVGAVYLYLKGSIVKAVAMVIIGLIVGVVDNFIRPWVLKGRGEMHPLIGLVVIFGGIEMFGLFGVFIGPILAAVVISMLQIWPRVGRRFGLLPPHAHHFSLKDQE